MNLLTTEVSSMKELLGNALKIEQLLANPSTTNINYSTGTPPDNETLLSLMISGMTQIVTNTPTSPSFKISRSTTDVIVTITSVAKPISNKITFTLNQLYWSTKAMGTKEKNYVSAKIPPGELNAPHIKEESNLSLPTTINGEFDDPHIDG